MGGGQPAGPTPLRVEIGPAAAIDDQAFPADADFEAQSPGVAERVKRWPEIRGACIHDHRHVARDGALEARMGRAVGCLAVGIRQSQNMIDQGRIRFPAAVELREPAIAETEKPYHRRHPVDCVLEQFGHRDLCAGQQVTQQDQVTQHVEMNFRRPGAMTAIGKNLAVELRG